MKAFLKTLFGDAGTILVVIIIMITESVFAATGQVAVAAFTVPPLVLAGTAWLATR
jgi:hypothetical protein